jgi:RNA polymerase sigma factor (sigma-70 family)
MEDDIKDLSGLVYSIAKQFTHDPNLINDLYQQGILGIINAKNNFNPNCGTKFSTYARMYIYGEIYKYINCNKMIKVNKDVVKMYSLIIKTIELLEQELKREPTTKDISNYLNIDEEIINNTMQMMNTTLSLNYEYEENNEFNDFLGIKDDYSYVEISELMDSLSLEEKMIITYRYYEGYSQAETAKLMNMSQAGVSRCETKSLEKMRTRSKRKYNL